MVITENFKNKARAAKVKGFKFILVSRTKNFGKYCYVRYGIANLLSLPTGTKVNHSGRDGQWETKTNPITKTDIFYLDVMRDEE